MRLLENVPDTTPVDDISGLMPTHITTRLELNEWETANILKAAQKHLLVRKKIKVTLTWLKQLHKEMFDETWHWAGKFRQQPINIGIDWHAIPEQMRILVDDLAYWEKRENLLGVLSQSVRFHHRLVKIHPFVNGNGRHARLATDIYLFDRGHKLPIWPTSELVGETTIRRQYIAALQSADNGNYKLLEKFTADLIGK